MKQIIKYTLFLAFGLFILQACEEDTDPGVSSAYPVAGEWMVSEYYDGEYAYGPTQILIYNTSFSKDSIIIDNIYDSGIKIKVKLNADKTFETESSMDMSGEYGAITIENGKVIGNDSIYFDVIIWDEGEVSDAYTEAGIRKTGFE